MLVVGLGLDVVGWCFVVCDMQEVRGVVLSGLDSITTPLGPLQNYYFVVSYLKQIIAPGF